MKNLGEGFIAGKKPNCRNNIGPNSNQKTRIKLVVLYCQCVYDYRSLSGSFHFLFTGLPLSTLIERLRRPTQNRYTNLIEMQYWGINMYPVLCKQNEARTECDWDFETFPNVIYKKQTK